MRPGATSVPRARSPALSVRSTTSATARARLAEIEEEQRLTAIRRREIELQIEADRARRELAVLEEQEADHPEIDPQRRVDTWLNTRGLDVRGEERDDMRHRGEERQLRFETMERTPARTRRNNIEALTEAMEKMAHPRTRCPELQQYSGGAIEWLAFKAAVTDAVKVYRLTQAEILQRLRSSLKGEARETVAALLYTESNPDNIMKTLERCYGRPEIIINRALDEIKKMPKPGSSAVELNKFAVKLQNTICALKTVGRQGYLYNPALARDVLDKLSPHLRARWCAYAHEQEGRTTDPELIMLAHFLTREADWALRYDYDPNTANTSTSTTGAKRERNNNATYKKKSNVVFAVAEEEVTSENKCPCCGKPHQLPECSKYKALSVEKRWDMVRENKLCFKCITKKHRRLFCRAKLCGIEECKRPHHATLHQSASEQQANISTPEAAKQASKEDTESVLTVATSNATGPKTVLLKMCPVTVVGPRGEINTHALLDEGATISLIDEELARSIGAKGPTLPLRMQGVSMTRQEEDSKLVSIHLRSTGRALYPLKARTIRNMKLLQQSIPSTIMKAEHLQDLPQEVCYDTSQPGILIGADHWEYIVSQELRVGKPNEPAASRTQLGWVIHGTVPRNVITNRDSVLHIYTNEHGVNSCEQKGGDLHKMVEYYFSIESLGVTLKPRVSDADQRAMEIVQSTIKKADKGYEVGLPWKEDNPTLPTSYETALRRLKQVEKKMDTNAAFAEEYSHQVDNLLKKGYAELCSGTEGASRVAWYLPHFAVYNPNKPGKLRLVFDAAAKNHGVSLNDHLLEGPDLLMSLPGILFRFREEKIAVTADIQEMFLQVKIRPEDQPAQQFLWRGADREGLPQRYKMTSMIFGAASSPFMAHYVRNHNGKVHQETHPLAYDAIVRSHYMDDFVASYETEEQARRAITELRAVHADAGFTLRAWSASTENTLQDIPEDLKATTPTQLGKDGPESKILGLFWNAERDEFGFNTTMTRVPADVRTRKRAPTKREALSAVMSVYDPLGVLSCYTIRSRIILQSLWRLKMTWDEPIPEEENELFSTWLGHLDGLATLRLERRYALEDKTDEDQLSQWLPDIGRFSKYETLVRATARVLAFIDMCRRRATRLELEHIERAEQALIRRAQEESFETELKRIKAARPISRSSRLFKLDPILEDGLLRVRGRINAATAPAATKRPIILDGRHQLTKLIVLREHCSAGHANRERVTNDLRQKYWILHLRPTVRAAEYRCALCRVLRARPKMPTRGDLPRARLDSYQRPFTNCGQDYFGPMTIKIGRRREKRWGALYTCLSTRAIHLELVASLSTDSAIMALRRMAARRGWPRTMYSDNATAFRGADEELKRAYAEWIPALREEGLLHRMKWIFIPPGAPNQGGAWERLVRSVKTALAVTLKEKAPTEEVLYTLLAEAEHAINARPLTHVSVSDRDPEALTPNHFLIGSSTGLPTTGPCDEADRRTWRVSQALADTFWRRWVREYLPTLVPRGEPASDQERLQVGDIVIVVDSTLPRNAWPRGIVERVYPGPDGEVRVAEVRTRSGIFKRPTSKLAVLVKDKEAT